jgi:hypothetical protein
MQTRAAGDDPDGCDKCRPPPWSFSVCIFSWLAHPSDNLGGFHLHQAAERDSINVVAFQQLDDQVAT